jgi:beta-galactosidase
LAASLLTISALVPLALAEKAAALAVGSLRERISIDHDWRFQKGDPEGVNSKELLYDTRPRPRRDEREQPADFTKAAERSDAATHPTLKPWILPTGNRFIRDPARRYRAPIGNPGSDNPYVQRDFDDTGWRLIDLPHDWAIEGPFGTGRADAGMGRLPCAGVAWYRKKLTIPASDSGKSIFLDIDGAMSYATVWLNGKLVGGWPYGYASWRVDLTPYVVPGGDNQLAIRLDNPPESSRWYPGAGIYRNVWLTKTGPIHVGQWGTFLTTPSVTTSSATVDLEVTIDNDSKNDATVNVQTQFIALGAEGQKTGPPVSGIASAEVSIAAGKSALVQGSAIIPKPRLWGPPPQQKPNRYVAVTTVSRKKSEAQASGEKDLIASASGFIPVDCYETRFGIRSLEFRPDGVYVNGERIYLKGVNNHHDLGALGTAFNVRAAERQLALLREMGCNAVRTCHNPPAPELLELTDRMGFLVMDEIFDSWYRQKRPLDFHLLFADWHEQDLLAFIRRDRNCPSVILWSVGNEVGEQFTGGEGAAVAKQLCDIGHEEDPTRPATSAMNVAGPGSPFADAVDVISLNYQGAGIRDRPGLYQAFRAKYPGKMILSSESAAALSTRGEYLFPVSEKTSAPVRDGAGGNAKRHVVSAYELYAADFGSSPDRVFTSQDRNPDVAGEFVWSGWDYLGEPTPYYSSRSSYFGIIDLAGFKKDRFYVYQAKWRPDLPMAHILPHWTWPERIGLVTPVHVFTSGDEAELFLNGLSLGRKKKGPYEYRLRWDDVVYTPGELNAVAYKDGKEWAADVVRTADVPAKLQASADRDEIRADGVDLAFVTVRVTDKNGTTTPRANNRIKFTINGPGEIAATDNGDPTSFEPFQATQRMAFNGLALAIIRPKRGKSGTITLHVAAEGLTSAESRIKVLQ